MKNRTSGMILCMFLIVCSVPYVAGGVIAGSKVGALVPMSAVSLFGGTVENSLVDTPTTAWLSHYTAKELSLMVHQEPALIPRIVERTIEVLDGGDLTAIREVQRFLADTIKAYQKIVDRRDVGPAKEEVSACLALLMITHPRFKAGGKFREQVLEILHLTTNYDMSPNFRDRLLTEINNQPGFDFESSEDLEYVWRATARTTKDRQLSYEGAELKLKEANGSIRFSIFSLPSRFFKLEEIERFLRQLRQQAPNRNLVVMSDLTRIPRLERLCGQLDITLIETHGRKYSPWIRDPVSFFETDSGTLLAVQRPDKQFNREEDYYIARELIQGLPESLDEQMGKLRWAVAPITFHNGKILIANNRVWINLDTLEKAILRIMKLDRVPVERFQSMDGIEAYLEGARAAMAELAQFFNMPVHLTHPLPETGSLAERMRLMRLLGASAGFDLDTLLTLLPRSDGSMVCLVADLSLGSALLAGLSTDELARFSGTYGLLKDEAFLRSRIHAYHESARAVNLGAYLDLTAQYLARKGHRVERLPMLIAPTNLIEDQAFFRNARDFLVTWNNVVLENRELGLHAEGFASGLPRGDRIAVETFARAGCTLHLLPPLVGSIMLGGGYRCCSKHIRLGSSFQ